MPNRRPKILVVDDDPGMRVTLEGIIEDEGCDVVVADDGYKAIELARETFFAIIFMDIKMPGINGVETFREIKKVSSKSVVIMMTGFSVEDLVKQALQEGAYAVIFKPIPMEQVVAIVEAVVKTTCILVVGDLPAHRETLQEILKEDGYEVSGAADGAEAVSMVADGHYSVILMDIRMPGMNGIKAFEEIRKVDPKIKILFISGFPLEDSVKQSLDLGAYTLLGKPVDPEELLSLVNSIATAEAQEAIKGTLASVVGP